MSNPPSMALTEPERAAVAPPLDQLTHGVGPDRRRGGWFSVVVLALFVVGAQLAGVVGLPFSDRAAGSWYDGLDKPAFDPPSWVFAPVWTVLYLLIGVAAWLVWRHRDSRLRSLALVLFAVQLACNAAWSPVFFGAESLGWAFAVLVLLWGLAVATLVAFWRVDRSAGALFVPYVGWITFAGVLNGSLLAMN